MQKDAKTFKEVAERCTRFSPSCTNCGCGNATDSTSATNSTSDSGNVSCGNCKHYTPGKVCDLDLYQEIMENHHL